MTSVDAKSSPDGVAMPAASAANGHARIEHQPALDGLRGAAVAGVLLFHGGHLTGGYLGVDAFFVLSGFLITSLLIAELAQTAHVSLAAFWARRARRLLPALGCVLAAVTLYAVFVARPDELATIRGDALWTIGYAANWHQIFAGNDYFALFRAPSPLQHTWSLGIEEQFYVLWPIIVVLVARGRSIRDALRNILTASLVLGVISALWSQLLFDPNNLSRVYYGTDTRIASILVGAALSAGLALRGPMRTKFARGALEVSAWAAVVLLALAWARLDGASHTVYRGGLLVCAIATATVIAAAVHPQRGTVFRLLSFSLLRALGRISYGAYLWHWPIYVWLDAPRVHLSGWPLLFVRIAVTLVVSLISYRFVEQPIRRGAGNAHSMRIAMPVVTVVLVAALIGATQGTAQTTAAQYTGRGGVLVVGDSTAKALVPGLIDVGLHVADSSVLACRLIGGAARTGLYEGPCKWRSAWRKAVDRQRPDVVVMMIGIRDLYDTAPPGTKTFVAPGDPIWNAAFAASLEQAVRILTRDGAQVVVPVLPCISNAGPPVSKDRAKLYDARRLQVARQVVAAVMARHLETVSTPDLNGFLCPSGKYQTSLGTVSEVRGDGVHLTRQGADMVARWLLPWIHHTTPGQTHDTTR